MWFGVILFLTVMIASFVQSTTGFGFAILIMSIWPLFLPVVEATQLMLFGSLTVVLMNTIRYRRHINFRIALVPAGFGIAGTFVGVVALVRTDNEVAVKVIGVILILVGVYLLAGRRPRLRANLVTASAVGIVSGLMSGFLNIAGPPAVIYYTIVTRTKEEYLGTLQFFFLLMLVFKTTLLWIQRGLSGFVVSNIPVVVPASAAGVILGAWLFHLIPQLVLRRVVLAVMIAAGLWYVVR